MKNEETFVLKDQSVKAVKGINLDEPTWNIKYIYLLRTPLFSTNKIFSDVVQTKKKGAGGPGGLGYILRRGKGLPR